VTDLPPGAITFLFTDIEGSTRLWEEHPVAMKAALERHDALLRAAIECRHGRIFKTIGDAFCAVFGSAANALEAALDAQRALAALGVESREWRVESRGQDVSVPTLHSPPSTFHLRVRMALHTGPAEERDGDYFGATVNRVARLLTAGRGGQVLVSQATADRMAALPQGVRLRNLGAYLLKDLPGAATIYLLEHPDLPEIEAPLRSLQAFQHNLPAQATSFVGRERELAEARDLLSSTRLLTLTGAGGTGKTRLALQVAGEVLDRYDRGAWLVELAALSDPALVAQTAATVLGIKEEPARPLTQSLVDYLQTQRVLLLLDNCEHLLPACAALVDLLLRQCPGTTVLATSREGLSIPGEVTYRVTSLDAPDPEHSPPVGALPEFPAVRLFLDRAAMHQPRFTLTPENAPAVAQICHRLDGIPLAIELAAARVKALPVERIAERLSDRFRFLTGGSRTALPRHQTLRALIDWSYELLTEPERALLRRLSVFAGGWTLEAAEAVCARDGIEAWEVLDLLTALVGKSLVLYQEHLEEPRYRLLETVRQYGRDRLFESGEGEAVRGAHAAYFLQLAHPSDSAPLTPERLTQLDTEHDNLRTVLEWVLDRDDSAAALQLTGFLWPFWRTRGYLAEGRRWLDQALARSRPAPPALRAAALHGATTLAGRQGDLAAARCHGEEWLALCRETGDHNGICASLDLLGRVLVRLGDYTQGRATWEERLLLGRQSGDGPGVAKALRGLGEVAVYQHDYEAARRLSTESLEIARLQGTRDDVGEVLLTLGHVNRWLGDYPGARACYDEALAIFQPSVNPYLHAHCLLNLAHVARLEGDASRAHSGYKAALAMLQDLEEVSTLALVVMGLGCLAAAQGDAAQAARLFGAAQRLHETVHASVAPPDRRDFERHQDAARAALGQEAFAAAWAEGQALPPEQAILHALEAPDASSGAGE
jgi:predicted ATPase/class 3 adenylate cyclase